MILEFLTGLIFLFTGMSCLIKGVQTGQAHLVVVGVILLAFAFDMILD